MAQADSKKWWLGSGTVDVGPDVVDGGGAHLWVAWPIADKQPIKLYTM